MCSGVQFIARHSGAASASTSEVATCANAAMLPNAIRLQECAVVGGAVCLVKAGRYPVNVVRTFG